MPYIFERQNEKGIIKDSVTGAVLVSAETGTVIRNDQSFTIDLGANENFTCNYSDIQTINGGTPPDAGTATEMLYEVFPKVITAADVNAIPLTEKGQAGGVATLGEDGKIPLAQSRLTDVVYKGVWNAATNTPTIADGAGTAGNFYVVSVGATRNLGSGNQVFEPGEAVYYNGIAWEGVPNANLSLSGGVLTGPLLIVQNVAGKKLILAMKDPGTQQNAPTALGVASEYLRIGGGEWNQNSFRTIGFGYVSSDANHAPAFVGYQETSTTSNTRGDVIIGTRPNNNNEAPVTVLRVNSAGQILAESAAYVPASDQALVNRKYADRGRVGTTAQRPTGLLAADIGFLYYDSTLKKPIWWDGTAWTDASGVAL